MINKTVKALLLSLVIAFTSVIAFAEGTEESVAEETTDMAKDKTEQDQSAEKLKTLGDNTSEADYQPIIKNATGKEIKSVEIQVNEDEFGENLLMENDIIAVDEKRVFYFTPAAFDPEIDTEPPRYDVRLTFVDDTDSVIHTFPFGDADTVDFCLEDGVAYIRFHSLFLDEDQDTLRNERALLPVETPSYYTDDSSSNYTYGYSSGNDGGNYSGGGGGYSSGDGGYSGGGIDEECLAGGLLF